MYDTNMTSIYNDDFPASEQEHVTPLHADAYVHTSEFLIPDREGIDLSRDLGSKKPPRFVSSWQIHVNPNGKTAKARFNPNVAAPCMSLSDFETRLTEWAEGNGFNRSDVFVNRVDAAIDIYEQGDAPRFKKLCDLLVIAFVVKHNISLKDQYRGLSIIDWIEKNTKARAGKFEIEIYNKLIQDSRHGALWRLELRDWRDLRQQEKCSPKYLHDLLIDIRNELTELAECYDRALIALAQAHSARFTRLQAEANGTLNRNQFLLQHDIHIFSRIQIRRFHELCGDKHAQKTTANYCDRFPHQFISRKEFTSFVDDLKDSITRYLGENDTSK